MGLSSTTWFVIAVIIVLLGVGLLFVDRRQKGGGAAVKDRRRWAALRGWEFLDTDPVLPSRWRYGTIHQGGPGVARNLISGEVPLPDGSRQAYIFDHEQAGRVTSVLAAIQAQTQLNAAVELLWAEESWVLATAPVDSSADRLQELLADLAEVATALEQGQNAHT